MAAKPAEMGRPRWGYCRVKVEVVCRLWAAYRAKMLQRQDIQVWFGVHEVLMRRCTLRPGRNPSFSTQELEPLTRLHHTAIRASIRRLEARGFLTWSEHRIAVEGGSNAASEGLIGLSTMLASVANHRRTLPIPRHSVLLLARSRRPVVLATILGHLLRGMYYRSRECVSWGTCKASWVSQAFGVDARNVKAARRELQGIGWLRQLDSDHWHRQRYGGTFVIPLAWAEGRSPRSQDLSPPTAVGAAKSPPPESHRDLPSGVNNQKRPRTAGIREREIKSREPQLDHVLPVDLADPLRTAELFRQASRQKLIQDSSMSRLQFFAAAERAKRLASNPGGFFVAVLKKRLWHHVAYCDEESARHKLAGIPEFFYGQGVRPHRRPAPTTPTLPGKRHQDDPESPAVIRELVQQSLASVSGVWNELSPATDLPLPPRGRRISSA